MQASFHQKDVAKLSPEFVASLFTEKSMRIIAGCAPCQPFSSYASKTLPREHEWQLLSKFGEIVASVRPEIVTMENVPRLTGAQYL